jgi:hypothetical protein
MPNIEIISVRFNLDKDEDRRLFDVLQKRSDPGKRNEFLKKVLFNYLSEDSEGGKSVARASKKQTREPAQPRDDVHKPEATGSGRTVAAGPHPEPKPVVDAPSDGPVSSAVANAMEPDPEAAGLVGSFVQ